MFSYCYNNPVNMHDLDGCLPDDRLLDNAAKYAEGWDFALTIGTHSAGIVTESSGGIDTKSPPPPETGYKAPKNPDKGKKRVPAPGARGETGWRDKSGNVWVPDNDMDGGAGWRVHIPDGSHSHVYPNGKVRSHAITWDFASQGSAFSDNISEITGLTGTALIIYLVISEGSRVIPPRNLIPIP